MATPYVTEILETPDDPLGGASGDKRRFAVEFIGKCANEKFPYTVVNEVVGTHLGIMLGLNVPTCLTQTIGENTFALIQRVNRDPRMQDPPPASSKALAEYVQAHPDEVHGAIVFDLFIANNDRAFGPQRRNLLIDESGKLLLYDQGNACFYRHRADAGITPGIEHLEAVEKELSALFDMDHKGNYYRQCLTDWNLVEKWCNLVGQLPDFVIQSAVLRAPVSAACPTKPELDRLTEFLVKRKRYLLEHIRRWKTCFTGLPS
ncbi:MAG: hypothetical protein HY289_14730 [Planctomycetes bacterium]|nr:hypothetical protein [Planctomycetota bacterium]